VADAPRLLDYATPSAPQRRQHAVEAARTVAGLLIAVWLCAALVAALLGVGVLIVNLLH
jgi:hypothetical protein